MPQVLNIFSNLCFSRELKKLVSFSKKSLLMVVGALLVLNFPHQVIANDSSTLNALQSKIKSLRSKMSNKQTERDKILKNIKERDTEINALMKRIRDTQTERAQISLNLNNLAEKQIEIHAKKQELQSSLMLQLEAAYKTGKQSRVKMLLNQKKPETIGRLLGYHNYLHIAREEKINSLQNAIEALKELEADVKKQTWQLSLNEEKLRRDQSILAKSKAQKKRLLGKINNEIQLTSKDLNRVVKEQQRVKNLITKLTRESKKQAPIVASVTRGTFIQNKAKLQWPVNGSVIHRYNSIISGDIRRPGIFIKANNGSPVRTIFDGKVVYSDQFQKKGLMTIISHGNGYMSLYAHNKILFRNVGDTVKAGDKIALAGDSGNTNLAGLYFEIRKNGKPVNPNNWLSK